MTMHKENPDQIEQGNFQSNQLFLKNNSKLLRNNKILEIGSGYGNMVHYLREKGFDITGTEIDDTRIHYAKMMFNVDLLKVKGEKLCFPDSSFGVVLSFDVFEHIQDSDLHLHEVSRILRSKGFYILQTPNKWFNIPFEILEGRSFTKYKKYHCSLHNYWQLKKRFQKNGFHITFFDIPVVNDYFKKKVRTYSGELGIVLLKIFNPDYFPRAFRTNFYIVAQKNE